MEIDSVVAEVRRIRDEYAREFNYDLDAIARDLVEFQKTLGMKVVRPTPRRIAPVPATAGDEE